MKTATGWGFTAILLLSSGCVDQRKDIALYRDELDRMVPPATRPAGVGAESGEVVTLHEAMALANRDNERLGLVGEDYVQALLEKDRAFATFLPTISLVPGWYFQEDIAPHHVFDLPVRADLSVNGYSQASRLRSAGLRADQRRELMLDFQWSMLMEVAYAYYGVMKAERAVAVLENSLAVQEVRVRDVEDKVRQGVVLRLALEQSRARAAETRAQLTTARSRVTTGRATLAFLIGLPYIRAALDEAPPVPIEDASLESLLLAARENRRDLRAAHAAVQAARQEVEAAFGQYLPAISVNLNAFLYRESFPDMIDFTGLVGVNLPLFTGGRIYAEVRQAWSRHRQSTLAEQLLTRQVAEQVERAFAEYQASQRRLVDLKLEVEAAREALRIATEMFTAGTATNLDRLDAQDQLQSAELRYESERYDRVADYLNLLRLVGLPLIPPPAVTEVAAAKAG